MPGSSPGMTSSGRTLTPPSGALHLVFVPARGAIGASPHREQSGDESGVRKSSRAVPYEMLWFGGAALTSGVQRPYRDHGVAQRASARPARPTRKDVITATAV